jgi:pimeloyl-ACP methyl ester carboxylesterase
VPGFRANEAIVTADLTDHFARLPVPVLVLWGTQDSFFRADEQRRLVEVLTTRAQRSGIPFVWKQYGKIALPDNGIQSDDIGHNLTWDAAEQVAIDIAEWISAGSPTPDWFRSDAPQDQTAIVVDDRPAPLVTWP